MQPSIFIVIDSTDKGGAERVVSQLANYWAANGRRVFLLTFESSNSNLFFDLDSKVDYRLMGKLYPILSLKGSGFLTEILKNILRVFYLRNEIKKTMVPGDIVISFLSHSNFVSVLATRRLPISLIVSERIYPAFAIGFLGRALRRVLYPLANTIVVMTSQAAEYFPKSWKKKIRIIPNPLLLPTDFSSSRNKKPWILGVGRLVEQKRFDLLIRAFSKVSAPYPEWKLKIAGEGSKRNELQALIRELHLSDRVELIGFQELIWPLYSEAEIFAMTSSFEGFPNALAEAMACGLSVIATDCLSGPRDLIQSGENGLLIPTGDAGALEAALLLLISNQSLRLKFAEDAKKISKALDISKIAKQWEMI
ncbi:MAG: glycosyl transferase group 1 [Bacteriovoracaceae bacterium]|nr:glycosyl transferase group 1 [Bacteriovoracaceae bacterium]